MGEWENSGLGEGLGLEERKMMKRELVQLVLMVFNEQQQQPHHNGQTSTATRDDVSINLVWPTWPVAFMAKETMLLAVSKSP